MLTLFDYLPSRNAWKIRQLLHHLGLPHRVVPVSIFEGEGRTDHFLAISPTGTVPALQLADGRALAESNAILMYLAEGTRYLPTDAFHRAKVWQWLSFEQERVESQIGALRYWTLTHKLQQRASALVDIKRNAALRALHILDQHFSAHAFAIGDVYTIADVALFAYASRAEDAGLALDAYPAFKAWIQRVEAQPGHLGEVHAYAIDPASMRELP